MTELWLVDLDAAAPALEALEREAPRLSADDRTRALRLADARERHHRRAAYIALRVVLERVAGAHVRGQKFVRGSRGKPSLAAGEAAFSLSHTGGLALIAVAPAGTIGVDLERARNLKMSSHRRHEILAVGAGLAALPLADPAGDAALLDEGLLQAWCRLEAFAKACGQGLARVLEEVGMRGADGRQRTPASLEAAALRLLHQVGLAVLDLKLPAGLHGAVAAAAAGLPRSPRPRRFPNQAQAIRRLTAPRSAPPG